VAQVQFLERRHGVFVIREEIDESTELSTCVLAVVPALAVLAFPFVRREVLDDRFDANHATRLRHVRSLDR
jgi:hypothetical protein